MDTSPCKTIVWDCCIILGMFCNNMYIAYVKFSRLLWLLEDYEIDWQLHISINLNFDKLNLLWALRTARGAERLH